MADRRNEIGLEVSQFAVRTLDGAYILIYYLNIPFFFYM